MRFAKLSILVLLVGVSGPVAAETVFDNLDGPRDAGHWFNDTSEVLSAQPFLLGDNDKVISVTTGIRRHQGQPNGTLYVDIFDDSGSGTPGVSVGRVGSIDPLAVSTDFAHYTFDSPVSGLTPNETYYVVMSHDGTNWGNSDHVEWGLTSQTGAAGAPEAMSILPPIVTDWHTIRDFPTGGPPFSVWFFTEVEAVPEPSTAVLSLIACLSMLAWRRKRA